MLKYKGAERNKVYISHDKKENKIRVFRLNEIYSINYNTNEVIVRSNSVITIEKHSISYLKGTYQKFSILNEYDVTTYELASQSVCDYLKKCELTNSLIEGDLDIDTSVLIEKKEENLISIKDKTFKLYLSQEEIEDRIKELSIFVNSKHKNDVPVFLIVLKGSFLFAAELIKNLNIDCEIHFIKASSYRGIEQGNVIMNDGFEGINLTNRNVYIIEDIVDTGNTLDIILKALSHYQPKKIKVLSLLDKPSAHKHFFTNIIPCFKIPNDFVVGYGLDYDQLGRNLKNIYSLYQ